MATRKKASSPKAPSTEGMAHGSSRALWKGAITFGLVHIPVGLYSATEESDVDFDWLDSRTMDPVGYKRINKRTGREITKEHIVKGVQTSKGRYVVLSAEEIAKAYPKTTQTIEIERFVDAAEIPFMHLERPYYTAPVQRGEKVYALLREALRDTGKAGLARVVIHSKQHLGLVVPYGPVLVLNLLRWGGEIRSWKDLDLPAEGAKAGNLKEAELDMARQLIASMEGRWDPAAYQDNFNEAITRLVEAKSKAGKEREVEPFEEARAAEGAEVIDLTELLRKSLGQGRAPAGKAAPRKRTAAAPRKSASRKTGARRAA